MNLYEMLTEQEKAYVDALVSIRERFGPLDVESSSIWVGYEPPDQNEVADIGVKCGNCAFHYELTDGSQNLGCKIVSFQVEENAKCRLAAIPDGLVNATNTMDGVDNMDNNMDEDMAQKAQNASVGDMVSWSSSGGRATGKVVRVIRDGKFNVPGSSFTITGTPDDPAVAIRVYRNGRPTDIIVGHKMSTLRMSSAKSMHEDEDMNKISVSDIDLTPTDSMASNARRGLELRDQYNRGGTMVGVARARDLANKKTLSPETVARMYSFFSRHEVDKQGRGFNPGEDGYPSNGRIAWLLWGGDSGYTWAKSKWSQIQRARMSKQDTLWLNSPLSFKKNV